MGAYLSAPVTNKVSCDAKDDTLGISYGASSMQGWRNSQEDAHNCELDFDPETSTTLFAVYDGHGGHEVATYCALNLPKFLKTLDSYKTGDLAKALEEGYIKFDELLTKEDIIKQLKVISGRQEEDGPKDEDDPNEMADLHEEATMSIEELILKYSNRTSEKASTEEENSSEMPGSSKSVTVGQVLMKLYRTSKKKAPRETTEDEPAVADGSPALPDEKPVVADAENEASKESDLGSNGLRANGTESHSPKEIPEVPFVSTKGKGKGKGLSNFIRKSKKSLEELEKEKKEAEKLARAAERKQNLRKRSGEDLYKDLASKDAVEEIEDELEDDEEDEDFVGADSSASEAPDEGEEDYGEDEEDDEEEAEEEEEEDVAARQVVDRFAQSMKEEPGSDSGCTAVVTLIRGNKVYVANAGDSRCVLSRRGRAVSLSSDHKPEEEPEKSRIEKAGGAVTADGRVNGGLNLSRAIGDHAYKQNKELGPEEQMITALPDLQTIDLEPGDEFLVLACDGIWNSKTNQEVVEFVSSRIHLNPDKLSHICEELFDECLAPNTLGDGTGCDNMTAIIVRLDKFINAALDGETKTSTSGSQKRPLSPEFPSDGGLGQEDGTTDFRSVEASAKEKRLKLDETITEETEKL